MYTFISTTLFGLSLAGFVWMLWLFRTVRLMGQFVMFKLTPYSHKSVLVFVNQDDKPIVVAQSGGPYTFTHGHSGTGVGKQTEHIPRGWKGKFYFKNIVEMKDSFGGQRIIRLDEANETVDFLVSHPNGVVVFIKYDDIFQKRWFIFSCFVVFGLLVLSLYLAKLGL